MRMRLGSILLLSSALTMGATALAEPGRGGPDWRPPTHEQRAEMMQKIRTGFILELGQLLELDTAGALRLSEQLKPYDDRRIQLRLDMGDAMMQLRQIAKEGRGGDAAGLAHRVAEDRVQMAQVEQQELEVITKGLSPDKVAKVAVFMAEYPRKIERLAHEIHNEHWMQQHGPPPGEQE